MINIYFSFLYWVTEEKGHNAVAIVMHTIHYRVHHFTVQSMSKSSANQKKRAAFFQQRSQRCNNEVLKSKQDIRLKVYSFYII